MINITTDKFEIYEGQGKLKIVTKDWYLAARIQQITNHYPKDTTFIKYEEPVFHFSYEQLTTVIDAVIDSPNQRNALLDTINQQRTVSDQR